MGFGERDHALEEIELDALRGRVRREAEDDHLRLRVAAANRLLELGKKVDARRHRHRADVGTGDHRTPDVDRVARVGHQHRVAAVECRKHQVREAFLRADRDDRFVVGVDVDGVAVAVPMRDRAAQARNALRRRVAVGVGPLRRFGELGDDVRRRRAVGVAHAHVDDVFPAPARLRPQFGSDGKDVGRKAIDAREAALALRCRHGNP